MSDEDRLSRLAGARLVRHQAPSGPVVARITGPASSERLVSLERDPFTGLRQESSLGVPLSEAVLLSPVAPGKIVAVGRNYGDHAAELGLERPEQPRLFFKPPSAVIGPGGSIRYPTGLSSEVHFEAELAVVIGRRARHLTAATALDAVLGYTCANDVTARDVQRADGQPSWAKAFDTFCPLGPWITTDLDPRDVVVSCSVNGRERQRASTAEMLFPVPELLAYITAAVTLEPGDVVLTGTPAGVGAVVPGDEVSVSVSGVGTLVNPVR